MASTGWLAMMNGNPLGATAIGIGGANAFTVGNTILNNAYSYAGHTGNGFIWWFKSPVTGNLTDFLFNVSAVVNGGSSTVKWELRGPGSTGNWLPSATIIDSGTLTCTSVGFQTVTGRTAALIAGNSYALCFADPSGNTTNYAQLTNSSVSYNITNVAFQSGQVVTSPNTGFNTVSNTSRMMYGGVKIGGTWLGGSVLDTMNTVTSGTYERGCRFQVPVAMTLAGIFEPQTDISTGATPGTFTLYPDSSATGGTNLIQWVMPTQTWTATRTCAP